MEGTSFEVFVYRKKTSKKRPPIKIRPVEDFLWSGDLLKLFFDEKNFFFLEDLLSFISFMEKSPSVDILPIEECV